MSTQFHEDYHRISGEPGASERSVGLVFTAVFALIGVSPLLKGSGVHWWAIGIAAIFCGLALIAPRALVPFNRIWTALGKMLHRIVSPVVLGVLYVIAVVPTGVFLRCKGADPLRLKRDPAAKTYWLDRNPPGPDVSSFKNQF